MMSFFLPDIEENEVIIGKFYWMSLTLSWDKTNRTQEHLIENIWGLIFYYRTKSTPEKHVYLNSLEITWISFFFSV